MKAEQQPGVKHWSHVMISPAIKERIDPEYVLALIAAHLGVTVEDIKRHCKEAWIIDQRHAACAYLKFRHKMGLKKIGELIGGRDHSTITNSIQKHNLWMKNNKPYRDLYNGLEAHMKGQLS